MFRQSGLAIDLTGDPVGQTRDTTYRLEDNWEVEIGLPLTLPGVELIPSAAVSRNVHL